MCLSRKANNNMKFTKTLIETFVWGERIVGINNNKES